jgi:predicted acetyltransferase
VPLGPPPGPGDPRAATLPPYRGGVRTGLRPSHGTPEPSCRGVFRAERALPHNGLMPRLVTPDVTLHHSFLAAMREFVAENDQRALLPGEMAAYAAGRWSDPAGFAAYVEQVNAEPFEETPRPEGWVPCTTRWYAENGEFLGRITLRHRLNAFLREEGGHIGYSVRPSARRRGHATAMLRGMLPVAARNGLNSVLVTCDDTNTASRRVIEAAGGVLEDRRGSKLRFWVGTGA